MARLLVLPGDGIGPEVVAQALRVLQLLLERTDLELQVQTGLLGGAAIDAEGVPAPEETLRAADSADAVLLGAVGGPAWDGIEAERRPEAGLLALRSRMGVYANLRPARIYPELVAASSLRPELVAGMDLLIVRELIGGIYFGEPRRFEPGPPRRALDTMVYDEDEISRIARVAFVAAGQRRGQLTSVDKANVLASSRLWRQCVEEVARDFPEVRLQHLYVDNAAMQLAADPEQFDVLLAGNLFGDVLSDLAGALTGSIGVLPSASIRADGEVGVGLYEPCHGSAPDLAGRDLANPIAAVLSLAMLLRHSLGRGDLAALVEEAVQRALAAGLRTADTAAEGQAAVGTEAAGDALSAEVDALLRRAA